MLPWVFHVFSKFYSVFHGLDTNKPTYSEIFQYAMFRKFFSLIQLSKKNLSVCLFVCLFKALLKKWDSFLRKLFQEKTVSKKRWTNQGKKASAASSHGRAQRAPTGERRGERSELPRASVASQRLSTRLQVPKEAAERFPRALVLNNKLSHFYKVP